MTLLHTAQQGKGKQTRSEKQCKPMRQVDNEADKDLDDSLTSIDAVKQTGGKVPPLKVQILIDDCEMLMEVDTGAFISIMSKALHQRLWHTKELGVRLQTYSREPLPVVGMREVEVKYESQGAKLPLVVVEGTGPTLLGRNWLGSIRLDWGKIHYTASTGLQNLLEKYKEMFYDKLGSLRGRQAKIEIDSQAVPCFCKAHTLPYAIGKK